MAPGHVLVVCAFHQKQRSLASPVLGKSVFLFHGFWNILEMCTTSK